MLIVSLLCIVCYRLRKVLRGEGVTAEGRTAEVVLPAQLCGDVAFIDRVREGAEGIGGVGVDVVEGLVSERSGGSGRGGRVELEGVEARGVACGFAHRDGGLGASGVEYTGAEEVSRVVDRLPFVGGARNALDGVPGGAEVIRPSGQVAVVRGAVVWEDAGGAACPHGIVSAEDFEVVREGFAVGGVVVEDEPMPFAIRLDPPD